MKPEKKYRFDIIAEDLTMASNNFAGSQVGQGNGMSKPKKMSIPDLLKSQEDTKDKQNNNPGTLPYPVTTSVMDMFLAAFQSINDVKGVLKQTVNNPIIATDKGNREAVKQMYEKCNKIQSLIKSCGGDLDNLLP